MGTVERAHSALKKVLRIYQNDTGSNWHKYMDFALFCHNSSYHTSIGCTPSLLFHGREPLTPLDLRFRSEQNAQLSVEYDYNTEVPDFLATPAEKRRKT